MRAFPSGAAALFCFVYANANATGAAPKVRPAKTLFSQQPQAALLLKIEDAPAHGLVVEPIDLAALEAPGRAPFVTAQNRALTSQFVPAAAGSTRGTLLLRLPHGGDWKLWLRAGAPLATPRSLANESYDAGNPHFKIHFDALRNNGFPSQITFARTGRVFSGFTWNDRLHDPMAGGFALRYDKNASLSLVSDGPLCTVLRIGARYLNAEGGAPASQPAAVYDWYVWKDAPLVYVAASTQQNSARVWKEHHFLELHFTDQSFSHFAGDALPQAMPLTADKKAHTFARWGALVEGRDAIGMFGGPSLIYDGRGEYGTYLHFAQPQPWQGWNQRTRAMNAWLWIGSDDAPVTTIEKASTKYFERGTFIVTTSQMENEIAALHARASHITTTYERHQVLWQAALAERAVRAGHVAEAAIYARGQVLPDVSLHAAGALGMALRRMKDGLRVEGIADLRRGRDLLAGQTPPLWTVSLRGPNREEKTLNAASGWKRITLQKGYNGPTSRIINLRWSEPSDARLRGVAVTARAVADDLRSSWIWEFRVTNTNRAWGVGRAVFPQLALADVGKGTKVLFPRGPGEVQTNVAQRGFSYSGDYPDAGCTMQLLAVYHEGTAPSGLYFGLHDPHASFKKIEARGDSASRAVRLAYDHAAPDMNAPGNGFAMSGRAVWQLLDGDWFDAAQIYKSWARREADWWPKLGPGGRADTALWMRQLPAWAQTGGVIEDVVRSTKELRQYFGVPTALHWYNWHQIPFDNDYPHYFPTKEGFTSGVAELKRNGVFVMPYINGRLWDTRDGDNADIEFSRRAAPFATKVETSGALTTATESYGSKEKDGAPVTLAVMCPATKFWQDEMAQIVARLFRDEGVNAVYIDQVAAAGPVLCMDTTHGHPLGGGGWWVASYGEMLRKIRDAMPADRALTTECNAEPYLKYFDGYLTWNWQYDGQVPVFPAIYGGAIQMFGRAYRGGQDKALALRMKAAQQLAWGEQIGWADPNFIRKESGAGDFMRRAVQLRQRLAKYFYAGEMARPPRLSGSSSGTIPTVRADWQWQGNWLVSTSAILSGCWKIVREKRMFVVFSNVGGAPISANFDLKAHAPGLPPTAKINPIMLEGDTPQPKLNKGLTKLILPPHAIRAWEIRW